MQHAGVPRMKNYIALSMLLSISLIAVSMSAMDSTRVAFLAGGRIACDHGADVGYDADSDVCSTDEEGIEERRSESLRALKSLRSTFPCKSPQEIADSIFQMVDAFLLSDLEVTGITDDRDLHYSRVASLNPEAAQNVFAYIKTIREGDDKDILALIIQRFEDKVKSRTTIRSGSSSMIRGSVARRPRVGVTLKKPVDIYTKRLQIVQDLFKNGYDMLTGGKDFPLK